MTKNLQHHDSDSDQDDACIYPEAGMTVKEHARTVLAYATKHNLSQQALKGLLKLLQLHLPDGNKAAEKLEDVKRIAGDRNEIDIMVIHEFCSGCLKEWPRDNPIGTKCRTKDSTG